MLNGKNLNKNWKVIVTDSARKQIKRTPKASIKRVYFAIEEIAANPFTGDIKKIQDRVWRRRIGEYRIIFEILFKERIVFIYEVVRRTSKTY